MHKKGMRMCGLNLFSSLFSFKSMFSSKGLEYILFLSRNTQKNSKFRNTLKLSLTLLDIFFLLAIFIEKKYGFLQWNNKYDSWLWATQSGMVSYNQLLSSLKLEWQAKHIICGVLYKGSSQARKINYLCIWYQKKV